MKKKKMINGLIFFLLTVSSLITIFPILWTLITSLKMDVQMFAIPPDLLPDPATGAHYHEVLTESNFPNYLKNSIAVSLISCSISLCAGIPAAYGFAKYMRRSMKPVFGAVTAVRMVPQVAMVIPFFMIMRNLQLSDSITGLILTHIPFELTLIVWMLKNFF